MVDSTSSANIQIADWLTGAIGRRLEKKRLGEECSELILRGNTMGGNPWMRAVAEGGAACEEEDTTGGSPWSFIER